MTEPVAGGIATAERVPVRAGASGLFEEAASADPVFVFCVGGSGAAPPRSPRIWPKAELICLFRHPMDVITSETDACPRG